MTVFVLLNGCYSDEHIVGVFSARKDADLAATIFQNDAHIEEWDVDKGVSMMRRGGRPFFVRLHVDTGYVLDCDVVDTSYSAWSDEISTDIHRNLYTTVWAMNKDEAVKIAAERRRTHLATCPPAAIAAAQ